MSVGFEDDNLGIFDKACPQCMANNVSGAARCTCGYVFDTADGGNAEPTAELIAYEEKLFEEYLAARVAQATEAARITAHAAKLEPDNERKAVEAHRARAAAETAKAKLAAQKARAAHAAAVVQGESEGNGKANRAVGPATPPRTAETAHSGKQQPAETWRPTKPADVGRGKAKHRHRLPRTAKTRRTYPTAMAAHSARTRRTSARATAARVAKAWQRVVTKKVAKKAKRMIAVATQTSKRVVTAAQNIRRARANSVADAKVYPVLKDVYLDAPAAQTVSSDKNQHAAERKSSSDPLASNGTALAAKDIHGQMPQKASVARKHPVTSAPKKASIQSQPTAPTNRSVASKIRQSSAEAADATHTNGTPKHAATTARQATDDVVRERNVYPSEAFRATQAAKIAKAVEAARALEAKENTMECPLCTAILPVNATRCGCGWLVPAGERDIPGLVLHPQDQTANGPKVLVCPIECPVCTASIPAGASRCGCGWAAPQGNREMPPVMLSAEEQAALAQGMEIKTLTRRR